MNNHPLSLSLAAAALILLPSAAMAHAGAGSTAGWIAGFAHPLGGADHLLTMLAVGFWAALMGGRAQGTIPVTFVILLIVGAALGVAGIILPFVETGILVSLLVIGLLIASALRLPLVISTAVAAGVALLHGHAHGTEMPLAIDAASYSLGFAIASALLLSTGLLAGIALKKFSATTSYRSVGAVIAAAGLGLTMS